MSARDLVFTILGIDRGSPAFDKVGKAADDAERRLSSFAKVSTKVLAAFPAVALAAGAGAAGGLALVGAGVAAAATAMVSSQETVVQEAQSLWADFSHSAKAAAAPLTEDVAEGLRTVHGAANELAPQLVELFAAGDQAIGHLATGVSMFARNAMPGFVTAMKSSEPVMRGVEHLLADVGTGVTRFFTNLSAGAQSSGLIMSSTGRIIRDFAGFTGSLLAQLANSGGPSVAVLENFLRKLETTVLSLASGAFPSLAASASGFLTVGSGILSILNFLAPVLGPLVGHVTSFALALKLVDAVSFGRVSAGFTAMKTEIGGAKGAMDKFKAGAGSLMSSGLGPLGIAAAGLGIALTALGASQQRAAERQSAYTSALRESRGAMDDNVRATVAQQLAQDGLLQKGKDLGLSATTLTDAWMGNQGAIDQLRAAHKKYTAELEGQGQLEGQVAQGTDALSTKAHELMLAFDDQSSELHEAAQEGKLYGEAMSKGAEKTQHMTAAQRDAQAATEKIKASFTTLGDSMKSAAERGQAVLDILDRMSGKEPDLRESTQAWNDLLRTMTKDTDWNSSAEGVQKLGKSLVDMKGEVNTTTEAGSKLHDWAQQSAAAFANNAAAMQAAGVPADEMSRKLGVMRQQFIDNAVAQGLPRDAAIRLADAYHLVPGQVSTLVITPNLAQKMQEMGLFASQVRSLPNGSVVVTSDVDPARGTVTKLIQDINGRVATIRVVAVGTSREVVRNAAGGMAAMAEGGWIRGPGTTTSDDVLLRASDQEFLVSAAPARKWGPVLEAINAGRDPVLPMQAQPTGGRGVSGGMGDVHNHFHLTYSGPPASTVADDFRRMEILAGVG